VVQQDEHEGVEPFVHALPLAYVRFDAHDRYAGSTSYGTETLFRLFLLKELYGWDHETALIEHLECRSALSEQLGLASVPDQSTLWRSRRKRFTAELRSTVETAARTILIKAQDADVAVPRNPERHLPSHGDQEDEWYPDDQAVLEGAATITKHVSHVVFPTFSLDRGEGCEIHENAYWDLQTYLGLRERLAANEGARVELPHPGDSRPRWGRGLLSRRIPRGEAGTALAVRGRELRLHREFRPDPRDQSRGERPQDRALLRGFPDRHRGDAGYQTPAPRTDVTAVRPTDSRGVVTTPLVHLHPSDQIRRVIGRGYRSNSI